MIEKKFIIMQNQIGKIIFIATVLSVCASCVNEPYKIRLWLDVDNSIVVDSLFVYDSIIVNNYVVDKKITFARYSNGYPSFVTDLYMLDDSNYYEIRQIDDKLMYLCDIQKDTVLTLSQQDTFDAFLCDRVCLTVWVLQWGSMDYQITKEDSIYKTFKRSLQDSTYTETIYYDDMFQIYKFVNTWRGNKIVYK